MIMIKELLESFDGEVYDLCYKLINENENIAEIFQYTCENLLQKPENKKIVVEEYFTQSEISEYEAIFEDTVKGILNSTIRRCDYGFIKSEDFYSTLWQKYCTNFETTKEKAFAFYCTIAHPSIPYQYIGKPLSMDNDKFKELFEKNKANINKIEYVFMSNFNQKTERASLLLQCLDRIEDYESRVVVLVYALGLASKREVRKHNIDEIIRKIDEKIEELEREEKSEDKD